MDKKWKRVEERWRRDGEEVKKKWKGVFKWS